MDRRSARTKKVNAKIAVVDQAARQEALQARLAALDNDHQANEQQWAGADDDDDFEIMMDSDGEEVERSGKKRKKGPLIKGPQRKTRGMLAEKAKGPRTFQNVLEEARLDQLPPTIPNYLTAAAGAPVTRSSRKLCSVCSSTAPYQCTRCGARFCNRKCMTTHQDTRCLKMVS